MSIVIQTYHDKLLHLVYDDAAVAPQRYVIWFEGREDVVTADEMESPASSWQRVIASIQQIRSEVLRDQWCGRRGAYATVYAGTAPTEEERKAHIREHLIYMLLQIASPTGPSALRARRGSRAAQIKDSEARVQAALLAVDLLCPPPAPVQINLADVMLKAVRDELARRQKTV